MSYLLRVTVPDRPGALGTLATALGRAQADILNVAVVDRGEGEAVDDIVVELPPGVLAERLYTAVADGGARLESLQRWGGRLELADDLDLLDRLAADPETALEHLVGWAPEVFRSNWALLLDRERVLRRSAGAPQRRPDTSWLPMARAGHVGGAVWPDAVGAPDLELVAAPFPGGEPALLLGRSGGPAFRPSEVARLAHVVAVTAAVARPALSPPRAPGEAGTAARCRRPAR